MEDVFYLLAQNGGGGGQTGGDTWTIVLCAGLVVSMFVIWYFLVMRPRQQERQEKEVMLDSLKKGDEVLTLDGVFGTIVDVEENNVSIRIDEENDVRVRLKKWGIRKNITQEDEEDANA